VNRLKGISDMSDGTESQIRIHTLERADFDLRYFKYLIPETESWLATLSDKSREQPNKHLAKMAYIFRLDLYNAVVTLGGREFSRSENLEVLSCIRIRLIEQLSNVVEYSHQSGLELLHSEEPCIDVFVEGSFLVELASKYANFYADMLRAMLLVFPYPTVLPIHTMIRVGLRKLLHLYGFRFITEDAFTGEDNEIDLFVEFDKEVYKTQSISDPRDALLRIVKMADYLEGCSNHLKSANFDKLVKQPDRVERLLEPTLKFTKLSPFHFAILFELHIQNTSLGPALITGFLKARGLSHGTNSVKTQLDKLKGMKCVENLARDCWIITGTGNALLNADIRFKSHKLSNGHQTVIGKDD
jgi:hypothetical protein